MKKADKKPADPNGCEHEQLEFSDGACIVQCKECSRRWIVSTDGFIKDLSVLPSTLKDNRRNSPLASFRS